jgi:hypothetical protein
MEDEKLFYFSKRMTLERSKDEGEKRVYDFKWSCTAGCWLAGWLPPVKKERPYSHKKQVYDGWLPYYISR